MTRFLQTRPASPRWLAALALAGALCGTGAASAADLVLAYDELGRLVRVTDKASGATVTYEYDAAGNLVAIRRTS